MPASRLGVDGRKRRFSNFATYVMQELPCSLRDYRILLF